MSPNTTTTTPPNQTSATSPTLKSLAIFIAIAAITLALFPLRNTLLPTIFKPKTTISTKIPSASSQHTMSSPLKITKRPWNARGHADHGWLYTYHTFSFASYHDPSFQSFGPLRVINEDRVARATGFGTHSHAEYLIWSYIVSGELEHKDSMGNLENLKRGEVQFTSAGTGIRHSEYCRNEELDVHFLQIWAKPHTRGLKPTYTTREFPDALKANRLCRIMEDVGRYDGGDGVHDPIPLHADLSMSASILEPGRSVRHEFVKEGKRNVYLHVVMGAREQRKEGARIRVGDVVLGEGDGAFVTGGAGPGVVEVESVGETKAEFLLFDMGN